jgi:hypothetical protein
MESRKSVTDLPVSWSIGEATSSNDHQAELKEINFSGQRKTSTQKW